jgi:general secretion pathway protein G
MGRANRPGATRRERADQGDRAGSGSLPSRQRFYPTTEQGIAALVTKPTLAPEPKNWRSGGYLKKVPVDPWGNPYLYRNPGDHGEIDLLSLGPDGVEGGEGSNADITNW